VANHLTPAELAKDVGTDETEIRRVCIEEGIPIFHGKVDKTLFKAHVEAHEVEIAIPVTLNA
jgi:hypothetical protein